MNRTEITELLAIAKSAYPTVKIENPKAVVTAWEIGLGDYEADSVAKALRFHIETSKFFPTVADIRDKMVRSQIVYDESEIEINKLESGEEKPKQFRFIQTDGSVLTFNTEEELNNYLDNFCKFVGLGYDNEMEE